MRHALAFSALALVLAACATSSGPAPLAIGGASSAAPLSALADDPPYPPPANMIGQCNDGYPDAPLAYPEGWDDPRPQADEIQSDDPVSISDRNAVLRDYPVPTFPDAAAETGTQGACEVKVDVSPEGEPINLRIACTDPVFDAAARAAVEMSRFYPKIARGKAVTDHNLIFPLEFCIVE